MVATRTIISLRHRRRVFCICCGIAAPAWWSPVDRLRWHTVTYLLAWKHIHHSGKLWFSLCEFMFYVATLPFSGASCYAKRTKSLNVFVVRASIAAAPFHRTKLYFRFLRHFALIDACSEVCISRQQYCSYLVIGFATILWFEWVKFLDGKKKASEREKEKEKDGDKV